MIVLGAVQLPN